jgi:hypothetical protein
MLKCTINITGETTNDIELAIEEAKKNIIAGNTSGFDGNDSGNYSFTISEIEEDD